MMKKITHTVLIALSLFLGFQGLNAAQSNADETPKVMVVKVHADWCGSCRVIAPTYEALKSSLASEPVEFIVFDRTNRQTKKATKALAKEWDLYKVYKKNRKTGKVLVVNPISKKVEQVFTKNTPLGEMQSIIQRYLG